MSRARTLYVSFEGIDGAGKSTQLPRLAQALAALTGREVLQTAEPTRAEPYGAQIRRLLAAPAETWPEPAAMALLFALDRHQHQRDLVEPALARGAHVLCDRGLLSSLALQGPRVGFDVVAAMNGEARLPDLTLWLDLAPEQAAARLAQRAGSPCALETLDALRAQDWARAAQVARDLGMRVERVPADRSPDELLDTLLAASLDALRASPVPARRSPTEAAP